MKMFIVMLLSVLTGISAFAQEDKAAEYHVRVTKTDGTVFYGYNETRFSSYFVPYRAKVSISEEFKGEPVSYTGQEVRRVEFTAAMDSAEPVIFEAVIPQTTMPYINRAPEPYKEPVFLRLVYEGENIKGYAMPYTDRTTTAYHDITTYTWRYFYLPKDSDMAKTYWTDIRGAIIGLKSNMKFYFREFPELVKMVESGELTPKMFRENPAMVLPIMDKTYDSYTPSTYDK